MKLRMTGLAFVWGIISLISTACGSMNSVRKSNFKPVYLPVDKSLYDIIIAQDSILFAAFNARNIEALKSYFEDKLEVYQDNVGLRNYEQTNQAFTALFKMDYVLTRKPILESIEVYPIKNFGAIETGQHTFCHTENGKLECATFKFVHIWENKEGKWKIIKIITYDHKM
jgi:Domain of unknown function (DUF4440)